jgi:TIR domain
MADGMAEIAAIGDSLALTRYLRGRPIGEAQVLALRCAARVMPLITGGKKRRRSGKMRRTAAVFCALIFSWFARNSPIYVKRATSISVALSKSATFSNSSFVYHFEIVAAFAAAEAAASADPKVINLVELAVSAAMLADRATVLADRAASSSAVWSAIRADLTSMRTESLATCLALPLWIEGPAPSALVHWENDFVKALQGFGPHWLVVFEFYRALRNGDETFANLGTRYASIIGDLTSEDESIWEREPDAMILELAMRTKPEAILENPLMADSVRSRNVDFFISYSTQNVSEAREVNRYLEEAGYSTIVQFKDFPVGSNFVIEMQEGLERGARAIVLLSPDYVASDHCRAEWAAIYNNDPLGKRRKLVPLLLKPASLNKLARQIVYKSLLGLRSEERRAAVLEAIGHKATPLPVDMLRERLAETASPDVAPTSDGKLDAVPNAVYDRPVLDADLPDLPEVLKSLCRVIQSSLPENSPRTIAPTLQEYGDHLRERGLRPIVNMLCMHADALRRDVRSVEFHVWGDGLATHFENFFSCHSQFITHFPKSQEREEILVNNDIDEDGVSGKDFVEPVQKVAEALGELHMVGGTTPAFERVVQDSLQTAKDIDSLPNYPNPEEANAITPKRRFVFSQIGFWERILSALGSMTTLASTEQGRAAIAALSEAIKKFLSFISSH